MNTKRTEDNGEPRPFAGSPASEADVDDALRQIGVQRNGRSAAALIADPIARHAISAAIHKGGPFAALLANWTTAAERGYCVRSAPDTGPRDVSGFEYEHFAGKHSCFDARCEGDAKAGLSLTFAGREGGSRMRVRLSELADGEREGAAWKAVCSAGFVARDAVMLLCRPIRTAIDGILAAGERLKRADLVSRLASDGFDATAAGFAIDCALACNALSIANCRIVPGRKHPLTFNAPPPPKRKRTMQDVFAQAIAAGEKVMAGW